LVLKLVGRELNELLRDFRGNTEFLWHMKAFFTDMRFRLAAWTFGMCIAAAGTVAAGPLTGVVRTLTRAGATAAPAIVYAEPIDTVAPRAAARLKLAQKNKTFQPRLLPVPLGSSVDFPNNDGIFHNVFSLSGPQPFDLGLYRSGESRVRTFTSPGIYRIFCNIHPEMTAVIVVAPTGYTTVASADGRFMLDLPAGRYRLTALSERAAPVSVEVVSTPGASLAPDLTLDESGWVSLAHKNKFGKDYPAAAYQR
jgi:plastocyanin